jgi:hypothetical protein
MEPSLIREVAELKTTSQWGLPSSELILTVPLRPSGCSEVFNSSPGASRI